MVEADGTKPVVAGTDGPAKVGGAGRTEADDGESGRADPAHGAGQVPDLALRRVSAAAAESSFSVT